jgi:hypothetical protein
LTKWNHNFGRQLRLLMQHLETKQRSDSGADAEDTEHIRQACAAARSSRRHALTPPYLQALVSYRMNGFCINQPFAGMQPLVDSIFNSDIHNNGDLNEELWCACDAIFAPSFLHACPLFLLYSYFALAVYVKPFSGKVMSVWVYAAALVKRDAITASGRVLSNSSALLSSHRSDLSHHQSFHGGSSKNSSPAPPALHASASFAGRSGYRG